ncbi:MAG TPA: hypothetical protein VMH01_15285, partial [Puia sp.]|nr:hypothetical protein [Puia sp.]
MKRRLFILSLILINTSVSVFAQNGYSNLQFIENKGQWDSRISFRAQINNGNFLLQKQGFTVVMYNPDDMEAIRQLRHGLAHSASDKGAARLLPADIKTQVSGSNNMRIIRSHAYQVSFVNGNDNVEIIPDKPLPTYNNYFIGNDRSRWASHCQVYQGITYKNIYPNIDLRYYTDNGTMKYDIIVHPGADPDNIAMKYTGADKLTVKDNQLTTHTSITDMKEFLPHSYQLTQSGRTDIDCKYVLENNNVVKFKLKNYRKDATLIIDPVEVFCTFTGSRSDNWGYTATYDNSGNLYAGGIVLDDFGPGSGNGYPVSVGAFQSTFQGGDGSDGSFNYDVGIMKFNSSGSTMVYATYLGGAGDEQPHSLIVDNSGNLIIAGRTSSGSTFPVTSPTYGTGGGYDIFITKLNANGTLPVGSRLIGGSSDDGVNYSPKYRSTNGTQSLRLNYGDDGRSEVIVDASGNIYLASCTQSNNFPTSPNAFQTASGGKQDGVFIKTDPTLSTILACTYLGGSSDDAAFVLALNPTNGDVYVGGGTSSTNFPGVVPGVLFTANVGGIDGFVSVISNDGGTLRRTSYFGTTGTEVIYGVQFDNKGFPYIMGTTTGTWPVTPGVWSQPKGKQFVAKLLPDLSNWVYSTVFGAGGTYPDISPTAFLVDRCENVYVSGWGGGINISERYHNNGTNGLTTTPDALQKTTDGQDFYFIVIKKNAASQLYGSFFGQVNGALGDHVDGGTSRFDKQGIIYQAICANCYGGAKFPTTFGVWSPTNGTGNLGCNEAAVKIAFNFAGVAADVRPLINGRVDSIGCVPLNITLTDTIRNAK